MTNGPSPTPGTAELHTPAYGPKDGSMTMGDGVDGRPYISDPIRERIAMAEPTFTRNPDGVDLIAQERRRQIDQEGWTPEHDVEHRDGALAQAAACYALPPLRQSNPDQRAYLRDRVSGERRVPVAWPWADEWWKPTDDRVRELVKAGALIAAEIDRLRNAD